MSIPAPHRFHSFLAPQLAAYLQLRQRLGYTSFSKPYLASELDHYILFYGIDSVLNLNEGALVHWIHSVPERKAESKNRRISFARGFFRYLIRVGMAQANPAVNIRYLTPKPPPRHIYTLLEIQQILEEARKLQGRTAKSVLLGWTLETMILLIYACGLRISEALKLKIEDVDFEEDTLSLWKTKFRPPDMAPPNLSAFSSLGGSHAVMQPQF